MARTRWIGSLQLWPAIALLCITQAETSAAEFSTKVVDKEPPAEVDASIRAMLQKQAVQLLDGQKPVFEFWFSTAVPLKAKPESAAKALAAVKETTLLGVVSIAAGQRDYKDNELPAGVHTVRFALQPQDGDHLGSAEFPWFAVLVSAKNDTKPDSFATFTQLMKASGKGTSTGHPAVLSLRPPAADGGELPKLSEPVADHKSIRVKVPAKVEGDASLTFEIVIKGKGKT